MNEWHVNFSADQKKTEKFPKISMFFFPRFRKKKHDFRIWMNDQRSYPRKNKYDTCGGVDEKRKNRNSPTHLYQKQNSD